MRVALFRARDDAERTADRLRVMGHEPVMAPVIEIVPTACPIPAPPFDALVFASAHALDALSSQKAPGLRDVPAFCVGARTAARATSAGFAPVGVAEDAASLVPSIRSTLRRPARLLLVVGRERKPVIEDGLAAAGYEAAVLEIYDARAVLAWPDVVLTDWRRGPVERALHYSRRSAELACRCAAGGGLLDSFRSAAHCCLSDDVAAGLSEAAVGRIIVAERPNEDSLLRCLAG